MQKLRSIQVLRGIAACSVAFLHCFQDLAGTPGREAFGAFGVDLFFVISGFIIANVAQGRGPGAFLADRLWRIYPMWWVAVLPWLLMLPRAAVFVISSLTLWPIFAGQFYVPVLQVGWTLSFELLFYVGMTVAIASRPAVPLAIYGALLAAALTTSDPLTQFLGSPMALEFLLGVIVAGLPRRPAVAMLGALAIAALALTSPMTGSARGALVAGTALWRVMLWGVPAMLIVWSALSLEPLFKHRLFDVPVAIGDASYSIYLFHPLAAYGLGPPWPVKLLVAVGCGWAIHMIIERRLMGLRKVPLELLQWRWPPSAKGA